MNKRKFDPLRLSRVVQIARFVDDEKRVRVWRKDVRLAADDDLIRRTDNHAVKAVIAKRTGQGPSLDSVAVDDR